LDTDEMPGRVVPDGEQREASHGICKPCTERVWWEKAG
jgi:hypothetical protein